MKKKRKRPAKLCGANLVDGSGRTCGQPAGWGTGTGRGVCRKHGGNTRAHKVKAQREAAKEAVAVYGLPIEIDPADALLQEVWRTAGHIAFLAAEIQNTERANLALLRLYQSERVHMVRVCMAAIRAGIEERRVALAEHHGVMIAQVIRGILEEKGIADDADVPAMVRRHLTAIDGGKK